MTRKQKRMLTRILVALAMMLLLAFLPTEGWLRFGLYMIPYLTIGYDILMNAALGIYHKQIFDENFLMAIATVGAIVLALIGEGDYTEAVAVMLFYQIGEFFQSYAVGKSRKNISALMDIRPDYANIEIDGEIKQVSPEEIAAGEVILVRPGEKVPIDGVVIEGESELNTAALTGESAPRIIGVGDEIISGTVNMTGVLKIRTTKLFEESTVSKILDLVENASSRKSKSEAFISKFARFYTPAVCISALALALLPPLFCLLVMDMPPAFGEWLYRALTFLVISCPCALVISIPLTFFAGIGGASREGILVKGSNYLETLAKVDAVVFDKTGTLTNGIFSVRSIYARQGDAARVLYLAAHAEAASSHPIAACIRAAYGKTIDTAKVFDVREMGGGGVCAVVDGVRVAVGNGALMKKLGIAYDACPSVGTIAYVSADDACIGYLDISDTVKPDAKKAIDALRRVGARRIVMLTGDRNAVAEEVARTLGIHEVKSELLPEDQVACMEEIHADAGGKVAFVGDGINDAPVLSRADVGIAMGALGSDAAIEAADVVLMDDDPMKIAKAIAISRKCIRIVYQNIVFALGVKGVCLILGALGIANMWIAIFADVGVMVLAVLNAIRALWVKAH